MSHTAKVPYGPGDTTDWPTVPALANTALDYLADRTKTLEAGAGTGGFYFNRKTADSAMAATTALVDDADLQFPIGANEVWEADFVLDMTGTNTTGDIKLAVNVPSGATGRLSTMGLGGSATTATGSISASSTTDLTDTGVVGWDVMNALNTVGIARLIVINGSTAGIVKLRRAQFTASGTTTLQANSYVKATRVSPIQPAGANYGAMQLVGRDVLASAATSIGATALATLNLNADETYIVRFELKNASGSTNAVSLNFNGDTTAANYIRTRIDETNATTAGSGADDAVVILMGANEYAAGEIKINKTVSGDGSARCVSLYYRGATAAAAVWQSIGQMWETTGQNVISGLLTGNQATGLAAGSFISVYRQAPVPLAIGSLKNYYSNAKTADQTVTSSTALVDCTNMSFPIGANETWTADFNVYASGVTAGDIRLAINVPSGATGRFSVVGPSEGVSAFSDNFSAGASSTLTDAVVYIRGTITGGEVLHRAHLRVVNGSTAGTVQLRFAQGTSNGTGTSVLTHSNVEARRTA